MQFNAPNDDPILRHPDVLSGYAEMFKPRGGNVYDSYGFDATPAYLDAVVSKIDIATSSHGIMRGAMR